MADQLPEGLGIENVWAIDCTYGPDAATRRAPVRNQHIERLARLMEEGVVLEAGGYLDMGGSLILVRAASEAEALAVVRDDVYTRSGVWTGFRARELGRIVRRA